MNILILGGDGYLGWPTAMHFAMRGHTVTVVDSYLKRSLVRETNSEPLMPNGTLPDRSDLFHAISAKRVRVEIGDCCDFGFMERVFAEAGPDAVIHYAEQPSAPYSMIDYDAARRTVQNNLNATFNVIWAALQQAPRCHIVKLGTMGEYGTPNIDIEEGWLNVTHNGRTQKFLYPRQGGSLYHTTKVMDTDLLSFYVRTFQMRATDLMQGPVYGMSTDESAADERLLPSFHYDDIFGTVVNRFLVQAVAGLPLTVYGKGGQVRGYLNIRDTLQCLQLAVEHPANPGELRILNQFTEQFSVNQLAEKIQRVGRQTGLPVEIRCVDNPRKELEEHYYNAKHDALLALGLTPHPMTDEVVSAMLEKVAKYRDQIDPGRILPRVRWKHGFRPSAWDTSAESPVAALPGVVPTSKNSV